MAGLPTSSQGGKQRKGASHYREPGRKPKCDKDGFFRREEMVGERGFAKAELTYLLSRARAMHTDYISCLFVQSPVCHSQRLSPTSGCSCSSSPRSSRSGTKVGGRGKGGGGNSLYSAVPAGDCSSSSLGRRPKILSRQQLHRELQNPSTLARESSRAHLCPLLLVHSPVNMSTFAVRKHHRIRLPSSIKEFIDGVHLY